MGHAVEPVVATVHCKEGHAPRQRGVPWQLVHTEVGMEPYVETVNKEVTCHMTITRLYTAVT